MLAGAPVNRARALGRASGGLRRRVFSAAA
jgi:hypothetical protein